MIESYDFTGIGVVVAGTSLIWLVIMISVPLIARRGVRFRGPAISLGVVAQVALVIVAFFDQWAIRAVLTASIAVPVLGWFAEFIGSRTGIPFGKYHYTARLQPQVGNVPVVIPFAWLMMLPPSWAAAHAVVPDAHPLVTAAVGAFAFTAWDVYLDPHLVRWEFWTWNESGRYLGIPLKNFFGWFAWAFVITVVVGPPTLPIFPLAIVYVLTWLFQFGGHLYFWRWPVSAFAGFIAMGIIAVPVIVQILSRLT